MGKLIKALLICGFVFAAFGWFGYGNSSQSAPISQSGVQKFKAEDYVGSDACKDCHEDPFKTSPTRPTLSHKNCELERKGDGLRIVPRSRQGPHRRRRSKEDHFV